MSGGNFAHVQYISLSIVSSLLDGVGALLSRCPSFSKLCTQAQQNQNPRPAVKTWPPTVNFADHDMISIHGAGSHVLEDGAAVWDTVILDTLSKNRQ